VARALVETATAVGLPRSALVRQIVEQALREQRRLPALPMSVKKRP